MRKKLIMIGGPMGIGKTTVCDGLYKIINKSVWLDGDWCWMMNPWVFSKTNKQMVFKNIVYLLNNYLKNSCFRVVIFSWVLHDDKIYNELLANLYCEAVDVQKISLLASPKILKERLRQNKVSGAIMQNSIDRLKYYEKLDTMKLDTSKLSVKETVAEIRKLCGFKKTH